MSYTEEEAAKLKHVIGNVRTQEEEDVLQDLLDKREREKEAKREEETKSAIKRSKTLVHNGRIARKGHAFYKVEAVHKKQRFIRLVELSRLPSKKHEEVVFEELEVFLLKDMGITTPTEF